MSKLQDNNRIDKPYKINRPKLLFLTFENRSNLNYVKIHNQNISQYVDIWGYDYKFVSECDQNIYWCKMHMILDILSYHHLQMNYDYVVWLDSDTVIKKFNIDFGKILTSYSSDIFVGHDNNKILHLINAGVFAIKNTNIGKKFLQDCIDYMSKDCISNHNNLRGMWAGTCYEQGAMNIMIKEKYSKYTTILDTKTIYNKDNCKKDVFIMHLYNSSAKKREQCFL